MNDKEKLLPASVLYEALAAAGIASREYAPKWLTLQEQRKRFIYPKRAYQYERRKFTQAQVDQIVAAFMPDGPKHWKWPGK